MLSNLFKTIKWMHLPFIQNTFSIKAYSGLLFVSVLCSRITEILYKYPSEMSDNDQMVKLIDPF